MRSKPTISAWRALSLLAMLSAAAMLAVAGPVVAHDGGDHSDFHDDDPAGQIASFDADTGMLVIDLAEGGSIAGLVTKRTWIKTDNGCERRALGGWHNECRKTLHGSDSGDHDWHPGRGSIDDLVPGAIVDDALLVLKDGRAFFWKVDLDD
ncbi:MAG: hypothetical protein WA687_00900 [Solirubrobacterales bacterium]